MLHQWPILVCGVSFLPARKPFVDLKTMRCSTAQLRACFILNRHTTTRKSMSIHLMALCICMSTCCVCYARCMFFKSQSCGFCIVCVCVWKWESEWVIVCLNKNKMAMAVATIVWMCLAVIHANTSHITTILAPQYDAYIHSYIGFFLIFKRSIWRRHILILCIGLDFNWKSVLFSLCWCSRWLYCCYFWKQVSFIQIVAFDYASFFFGRVCSYCYT